MKYQTKSLSEMEYRFDFRSRVRCSRGRSKGVIVFGADHPVTLHDVSFVPDLGFNLFLFHVVQEKHEIILNKTGAHLLNGRLVFPRRSNGSFLRATRVMPGGHASANTALATFADPPSPVQYSSVTSSVAHETLLMSSSYRTSNAGAGIGGKNSIVAWEKGKESESVSSGNDGMAAAVLSPGAAGEDHLPNSGEEERTTSSVDHNIGEEISLSPRSILDLWVEGGLVSYIRSVLRVMWCVVAPLSPIQTSFT